MFLDMPRKCGFMLINIHARLGAFVVPRRTQKGGSMKIRSLSLVGLVFLALSIAGFSQTFRGGITGTLTDPSDAAIFGAAAPALQAETGPPREAVTTSSG